MQQRNPANSRAYCYRCGASGHVTYECKNRVVTNTATRTNRCYKCNRVGHLARNCYYHPNRCYQCNKVGHIARNCFDANRCFLCNRRGHVARTCTRDYEKGACYNCGQLGHIQRECSSMDTRTCYRCNGHGHIAKNCPKFGNSNDTPELIPLPAPPANVNIVIVKHGADNSEKPEDKNAKVDSNQPETQDQTVIYKVPGIEPAEIAGDPQNKVLCEDEPAAIAGDPENKVLCEDEPAAIAGDPENKVRCEDEPAAIDSDPGNKVRCEDEPAAIAGDPENKVRCEDEPTAIDSDPGNQVRGEDEPAAIAGDSENKVRCEDEPTEIAGDSEKKVRCEDEPTEIADDPENKILCEEECRERGAHSEEQAFSMVENAECFGASADFVKPEFNLRHANLRICSDVQKSPLKTPSLSTVEEENEVEQASPCEGASRSPRNRHNSMDFKPENDNLTTNGPSPEIANGMDYKPENDNLTANSASPQVANVMNTQNPDVNRPAVRNGWNNIPQLSELCRAALAMHQSHNTGVQNYNQTGTNHVNGSTCVSLRVFPESDPSEGLSPDDSTVVHSMFNLSLRPGLTPTSSNGHLSYGSSPAGQTSQATDLESTLSTSPFWSDKPTDHDGDISGDSLDSVRTAAEVLSPPARVSENVSPTARFVIPEITTTPPPEDAIQTEADLSCQDDYASACSDGQDEDTEPEFSEPLGVEVDESVLSAPAVEETKK